MNALIINENDDSTPKIILDKEKNILEISGISLPEDVIAFYKPVIEWLKEYIKAPNAKTEFSVRLTYFNTASSKIILDILAMFDELIEKGQEASITWYYPEMDDDLLASGKEFKSMLKTPFNYIPYVQD